MSLLTDFFDGATGLQRQMMAAFNNGAAFVVANRAEISTQLVSAAAAGKTQFTITLNCGENPTYMKLKGLYQKAYFAGLLSGLAAEEILAHQVNLVLNTGDNAQLKIDFNFTF